MKFSKVFPALIIIGVLLYILFSYGFESKKDFDKSKERVAKVVRFLKTINEKNFVSLYNSSDNGRVDLSHDQISQLIDILHDLRSYGPGHPVNITLYTMEFKNSEYLVELEKSTVAGKDIAYINVIEGNKEQGEYHLSSYISDELIMWANEVGLIRK